ncbi:MAG: FKBP-type peptidyl-prolyl cis-trans isomerase [Candidatus Zixiibacteriota bacterium]
MSQAQDGSKVKVHYTGKLDDGTVFDSSKGRNPFEFEIGAGAVIPGFEKGIRGMKVGETKTITIPPDEAYGHKREELIADVKKSHFPPDIIPTVGQQLQMQQSDGRPLNVMVTEINGEDVTLDANHPLAGKTLTFEVELVELA